MKVEHHMVHGEFSLLRLPTVTQVRANQVAYLLS